MDTCTCYYDEAGEIVPCDGYWQLEYPTEDRSHLVKAVQRLERERLDAQAGTPSDEEVIAEYERWKQTPHLGDEIALHFTRWAWARRGAAADTKLILGALYHLEEGVGQKERAIAEVQRIGAGVPAPHEQVCADCGGEHYIDCSLPSEVWNQIATPDTMLCPKCIDKRLLAHGLEAEGRFFFGGEALCSAPYSSERFCCGMSAEIGRTCDDCPTIVTPAPEPPVIDWPSYEVVAAKAAQLAGSTDATWMCCMDMAQWLLSRIEASLQPAPVVDPCEVAYHRLYPRTAAPVSESDQDRWHSFEAGWKAAKES